MSREDVGKSFFKILVMLTCFNRKEKTKRSLETLVNVNKLCAFTFIIVDDGSTDGTGEMIQYFMESLDIIYLKGDGQLFYSGGMNKAMSYAKKHGMNDYDYYLLINDDVEFYEECIDNLITQSRQQKGAIIVGTLRDDDGKTSYGAVIFVKNVQHRMLEPKEWEKDADSFNANCVLIPNKYFNITAPMDDHYKHAMGDWDYGMDIRRNGAVIHPSKKYVGICNRNPSNGLWSDTSLSRIERLKRKETVKGLPRKQWFYYLKKNFGIWYAVKYSLMPYINIILGR